MSILFPNAGGLKEGNISFTDGLIEQNETVEYLDSKLRETMASNVLKRINTKLKVLYQQSRYLTHFEPYFLGHISILGVPWFSLLKKN